MTTLPIGVRQFNGGVLKEYLALLADPKTPVTVHVSTGESERVIHFSSGAVSVLSTGERSGPGILGLLVRRGKLDAAGRQEVLAEAGPGMKGLPEALARRQLLTAEEHAEWSRKLVREEIFDLVFWEDALSRTSTAPPSVENLPADAGLLSAQIDAAKLADEVKSWIEKWGQLKALLHGDHWRLSLKEEGLKAQAVETGPEKPILDAVGGGARLRSIWRGPGLDPREVCDRLARFAEKGWIAVEPDPAAVDAKTVLASIDALEQVLPRALTRDLACMKLVALCRKAKLGEKACRYLQLLADEAAGRGDWESACESLRTLLTLKPEDGAALRQAVKLFTSHSRDKLASGFAFQVCQALLREKKAGELTSAIEVLAGIPHAELLAREARADLTLLSGNKDQAAKEYQEISVLQEGKGDLERAKESIGKAIGCVPANEELKKRFLHLKRASVDTRRPRATTARRWPLLDALPAGHWIRKRPALAGGAAAALLLVLILGAWFALGNRSIAETRGARSGPAAGKDERGGEKDGPGSGGARPGTESDAPAGSSREESGVDEGSRAAEDGRESGSAKPVDPSAGLSLSISDPFGSALEDLATVYGEGGSRSPDHDDPQPKGIADAHSSAGAAAAAGEPPAERARALAGGMCPRHGAHRLEVRLLGAQRRIRFAHSCDLTLENSESGEVLLDIEGGDGRRWSIGAGGEVVWSWKPGGKALIYKDLSQDSDSRTSWIIPPGTEALAVGRDIVALRQGATTRLFTLDGIQIRSAKLPAWDEGVITASTLVISAAPEGEKAQRVIWMADAKTLKLLKPPVLPAGKK